MYVIAGSGVLVSFVYGPPDCCDQYVLYPETVDVLAVHDNCTECATGAVPVPERVIESGEFVALLVTETLPFALPAADGANVAVSVAG